MLDKYRPNFESLTPEEAALAMDCLTRRVSGVVLPGETTGGQLFDMCCSTGIDQADVVLALASDPTALGVSCLEKIVGRPIQRPDNRPKQATTGRTQQKPKKPRPVLRDDRVIRVLVETNPKRPGSKSHARFGLYEDGMTVQQFVQAGGTAADVKWDAERGYIRVEDPK